MPKTQFIADFAVGDEVSTLFLLGSAQQGQAKNGPFWRLELRDSSGKLEAKIWSPLSQAFPTLAAGDIVAVNGRVTMFRERLEVAVDRMRILAEEERNGLDLTLFMASCERPAAELLGELKALCKKNLTHGPWKKFVKLVLADPAVLEPLHMAPAAKAMHHAYAGGLLEHTLGVSKLCMTFADLYPDLDRQTLLAGALCHDIGKIWEMTQGLATDYTTEGKLLGHMQLVLDFLDPLMRKAGLEEYLVLHLKHLILSHHGQHEFGSPRLPATAEAFALHYADNLDAKLNQVRCALDGVAEGEAGWSAYINGLDRALYKPMATPKPDGAGTERKKPCKPGTAKAVSVDDTEPEPEQLSLLGG